MEAQTGSDTRQQAFQGAGPLLVSAAAAAAAGALAVLARKALSGRRDEESGGKSGSAEGVSDSATSFDDVGRVADDLASLVDELRSAGDDGGSERLVEIADTISEYADEAADAFNTKEDDADASTEGSSQRVSEDLMSRVREITAGQRDQAGSGSSRAAEEPSRG